MSLRQGLPAVGGGQALIPRQDGRDPRGLPSVDAAKEASTSSHLVFWRWGQGLSAFVAGGACLRASSSAV